MTIFFLPSGAKQKHRLHVVVYKDVVSCLYFSRDGQKPYLQVQAANRQYLILRDSDMWKSEQ